jgi:nicotinate-nucleotide adenylyltransferase
MKKIAIFGTSADPPTIAHQSILKWLGKNFDLVAVYASNNPFKEHFTNLTQRSEMLKLLIEDLGQANHNIQLCQEISDRRSLNTIHKAREKWGFSAEFYLVIGSDLISQIQNWYCIEELLKKVIIVIMPRPDFPIKTETIKLLEKLGGNYQIAQVNLPAVSSTKYRNEKDKNTLTESVKNYLEKNYIYE